jgi:hypothetical protein
MKWSRKATKNLICDAVGPAQFGTGYISITSLDGSSYMSEKRIKKGGKMNKKRRR